MPPRQPCSRRPRPRPHRPRPCLRRPSRALPLAPPSARHAVAARAGVRPRPPPPRRLHLRAQGASPSGWRLPHAAGSLSGLCCSLAAVMAVDLVVVSLSRSPLQAVVTRTGARPAAATPPLANAAAAALLCLPAPTFKILSLPTSNSPARSGAGPCPAGPALPHASLLRRLR
jgi:hypothetical protein